MKQKRSVARRVQRSVELFLKKNHTAGKPVLFGFSGGHDSRVLFEVLAESGISLIVAHVDHGWRKESEEEANRLRELVEKRGIPFILHRLKMPEEKKNLEDKCREERYAFFKRVYCERDCQALVLGHQADDQVETVLKRLFEGAHFTSLGAMRPVSAWGEMAIWRPLLEINREDILAFLEEKKIRAIDDRTNYDTSFLRARMRAKLLPDLEAAFGKNFRDNLLEFARSFQELSSYFASKAGQVDSSTDFSDRDPLEIEVALKGLLQGEGIVLGTRHLKQVADHLAKGAIKKKLLIQKRLLIMDRGKLFITNKEK